MRLHLMSLQYVRQSRTTNLAISCCHVISMFLCNTASRVSTEVELAEMFQEQIDQRQLSGFPDPVPIRNRLHPRPKTGGGRSTRLAIPEVQPTNSRMVTFVPDDGNRANVDIPRSTFETLRITDHSEPVEIDF